MEQFDVIVIGSGCAGQRAALEAARGNLLKVALVTKIFPPRSATAMAQGGINGVLRNAFEEDSLEAHVFDTIKGGDYLGDQDAIEYFVKRCPEAILEMDYLGCPFSRTEEGTIAQRNFGGQSHPRTAYSADKTGHVLLHTLYEQCLKEGVQFFQDYYLLDIVLDGNEKAVSGIVIWHIPTGEIRTLAAKAIVIATGGAGRIYWNRTTNPYLSTGDGIVAAFRVGVPIKDAEMIQFHPTGLSRTGILVSEAVRGEGGYLINKEGERFMKRYAPHTMELAPRDVVAKAIETEIAEGRGFGEGMDAYVLCDVRHLPKEVILEKLHGIRDLALSFEGMDPLVDPIPIRPTCHYTMGGIDVVDYRTGETQVKGLFAAGEASCVSIHGANRLGGNSLADGVVFGKVAGEGAKSYAQQNACVLDDSAMKNVAALWEAHFSEVSVRKEGASITEIRETLARIMWNQVGIFREEKRCNKLCRRYTS